jgi:hypothetical protein
VLAAGEARFGEGWEKLEEIALPPFSPADVQEEEHKKNIMSNHLGGICGKKKAN